MYKRALNLRYKISRLTRNQEKEYNNTGLNMWRKTFNVVSEEQISHQLELWVVVMPILCQDSVLGVGWGQVRGKGRAM